MVSRGTLCCSKVVQKMTRVQGTGMCKKANWIWFGKEPCGKSCSTKTMSRGAKDILHLTIPFFIEIKKLQDALDIDIQTDFNLLKETITQSKKCLLKFCIDLEE